MGCKINLIREIKQHIDIWSSKLKLTKEKTRILTVFRLNLASYFSKVEFRILGMHMKAGCKMKRDRDLKRTLYVKNLFDF